ncbi:hypothetical protein GJ496_000236 [Pomphorhynchus laevis]|nr:hypothetical protein GJ496_000236 [Pomphorhynchus laevis]
MGSKISSEVDKSDPTVLTDRQLEMLMTNTKYTEHEILLWHKGFLNDCPNGKLNKRKFVQLYCQICPGGHPEKFAEFAFNTFDTDRSGIIDFTEFLLAIAVNRSGTSKEKIEMAFDMYDVDGNGYIDSKELTKIITAIFELKGQSKNKRAAKAEIANMMSKIDVNNDSKISKEEFIYACIRDDEMRELLAPNV